MAAVGADGAGYVERLRQLGIDTRHVLQIADSYTAQALIMTDRDNNQITAFHPGAMAHAHRQRVPGDAGIGLGIVSPDGREAMLEHAEQFHRAGIPFVFDPGQGLPMFDGAQLNRFVDQAAWIAVNDYEARMLCDRMGVGLEALSRRVRGLAVTLGGDGCDIWEGGVKTHVPPVAARQVVDPTGCGDAWRGALLYGLEQGWSLPRCAALGNRLGALKIAAQGPQNYRAEGVVEGA
jgi:adenosine kinase